MFKVGSIRKIQVKDFVTYSYVELYPGPKLNMIIGPNGTGKSTIVAAIILGLGGNPKVVGRGTKISEYVKHNCDVSSITIHIQGEQENEYIKITRTITKQDKSTWTLNNKQAFLKDIFECIKKYNIQVDNLCQFLPQDRVQDFAKMNQQELLRETQLALCRDDLIAKQDSLISTRDNQKKFIAIIENNKTNLEQANEAKQRLEGKVQNFKKRKHYLDKINCLERKISWVHYDKSFAQLQESREDIKKATTIHENYKNAYKPLQKDIDNAKKLVLEVQKDSSEIGRCIKDAENAIRFNLDQVDESRRNINRVTSDMNTKLAQVQDRQAEIDETAKKIEDMEKSYSALVQSCDGDEGLNQKLNVFNSEIKNVRDHTSVLQNKREEILDRNQNKSAQLRAYENEINHLENVKNQRLIYLQRADQNAYEATLWLRENKHLFRGEIFEPIMLELNVLEAKNAKYVDNVIAYRDKIAFTCVLKEDMNTLIRHLRNEKHLTVNIIHSEDTGQSLSRYQPTIRIENLRQFGFYHYLNSLFTAPAPIMNYLCKTYRVHQIPVGNKDTNNCYNEVPKDIRTFFSDNIRYSVHYSRYTQERSVSQNEIGASNGGLSIVINVMRVETLKKQIGELRQQIGNSNSEVVQLENQITSLECKVSDLINELKRLRGIKSQIESIELRINQMQSKLSVMRSTVTNTEEIKLHAQNKIAKIVKDMKVIYEKLFTNYKKLSRLSPKRMLYTLKITQARNRVISLENQAEDTLQSMREAEATLSRIREEHTNIKAQAKAALAKAKNLSNNCTPDEEGFAEFRAMHNKLSSDLRVLHKEKDELFAKIDCLSTADQEEINEYQENVQLIEKLEEEMRRGESELNRITASMEKLESEWLEPLKQFIMEINIKFATAFERMGCAGEISLNTGDDNRDFAKYGLSVKVTYRNGEPLQELNNVVQSGGERAVATAAFMLSIQELTPVPFRCVDEINQGMDAENERRIFELIVETTDQENTAQYFLITPKLVPNLNFSRSQMIHIVHNGPFIEADRKWTFSKLCNPLGMQLH